MHSNRITALTKAAGRITASCLFLLLALFSFSNDQVDAAEVLKKTSTLIGDPQVSNNKVTFSLGGTVKYIQHAKYLSSNFSPLNDIGITRANTRITGFAYTCPGYYTTRIYSDTRGQSLLGYIQVYVPKSDINNSKCDPISNPPGGETSTPPTPAPPKSDTHPVPEITPDMVQPSNPTPIPTTIEPKKPSPPPVTQTFDQYCVSNGKDANYRYAKVPQESGMYDGDECCPVSKIDTSKPGTTYKVMYLQSGLDYEIYSGPWGGNSSWGCANYYGPITDTYCPADLDYNATTNTCDETDDTPNMYGEWNTDPDYYSDWVFEDEFSTFGVMSAAPPEEPEEPGEPGEPGGDGESCEENPDQDHCPPPCYCEKLGDWGYLCCVFDCPGWDQYLGFLTGLVGHASPPPVPDLPAPDIPNIFNILNDVDQRNPAKPTGQEDPNLGTSSFDANDIKNEAPEIIFRDDPTGGFNIVNPLETLPEDGSEAPRPEEELETVPYPGGNRNTEGGSVPKPSEPGGVDGEVNYPTKPGGTATPPTTGGTADIPTTGGRVEYPGI